MATIPTIGSYIKIRKDAPNRDGILRRLRGAYGTSTRRAFKVIGYDSSADKQILQLIVEDAWGLSAWVNANYVESLN